MMGKMEKTTEQVNSIGRSMVLSQIHGPCPICIRVSTCNSDPVSFLPCASAGAHIPESSGMGLLSPVAQNLLDAMHNSTSSQIMSYTSTTRNQFEFN